MDEMILVELISRGREPVPSGRMVRERFECIGSIFSPHLPLRLFYFFKGHDSLGSWPFLFPGSRSRTRQGDDLHDIRLGVRTAGAIDSPLSDLGENNLHPENP